MSTHNIGFYEEISKMKKDNKQCLLDTPRRVSVNNKNCIKTQSEKKYAYKKAMALLRITKGSNSNNMQKKLIFIFTNFNEIEMNEKS